MADEERFQAWLTKVCARELPQNPMARIRTLAKELAEGAGEEFWGITLFADRGKIADKQTTLTYLTHRWNNNYPNPKLLVQSGYLIGLSSAYEITKLSLDLVNRAEPTNIFISYKRSESSALALLILKSLKAEGLEAFVDLALEAGEDWHAGLKERIQQYDYFVLLLGKETLQSEYVCKEIQWGLEAGLSIIPVWHNGFKYQSDQWQLPPDIDHKLSNTHAIEVKEESALGYDTAITALLNRFGITP